MNNFLEDNTIKHLNLIKNLFESAMYERIKKIDLTKRNDKNMILYSLIFIFDYAEIEPIYHLNTVFYNIKITESIKVDIVSENKINILELDINENYDQILLFLNQVPQQLFLTIEEYCNNRL